MSITAKPTAYSVNTSHAKCPDHLWMIDEGTGVTLNDIGKVGGVDLTLVSDDMWEVDSGDLDSPVIRCKTTPGRFARNLTYTPPNASYLWVAIAKSASATNNAVSSEALIGVAEADAGSLTYGYIGFESATGKPYLFYDYGTNSAGNQSGPSDIYDASWHMISGMVRGSTTARIIKKLAYDGSAWQNSAAFANYTFPYDGGGLAPNALGVGCRPAQTPNVIFNGDILAVMAWDDFDWDTAGDSWIAELYADPWQFLSADISASLILPHRSSGGMMDHTGNFRG